MSRGTFRCVYRLRRRVMDRGEIGMKILIAHNRYQQRGGEDTVFESERDLLLASGHEVSTVEVTNEAIHTSGHSLKVALGTAYNFNGRRKMVQAIQDFRPDVVHVHNFFPLLSPSIFDACVSMAVPSVLTLHNYRLFCANGLLVRDGQPCEECVGHIPWKGVQHRCYRGSITASTVVASMIAFHNAVGTWRSKVAQFIALNSFARDLFIRSGLPADRISVKANFSSPPEHSPLDAEARAGFVYAGRLSHEKGIKCLLDAWKSLPYRLKIIGTGPLENEVVAAAAKNPSITVLGHQPRDRVLAEMATAKALIVPSNWYENFPMTIVEAFARGTPVIASDIGALPFIVSDGLDGFLFRSGDPASLRSVVTKMVGLSDHASNKMYTGALERYSRDMTPASSMKTLDEIYQRLVGNAQDFVATRNIT